jgi:hypothetical protein
MQPALHPEAAEKKESDHLQSRRMLSKMTNHEQAARGATLFTGVEEQATVQKSDINPADVTFWSAALSRNSKEAG